MAAVETGDRVAYTQKFLRQVGGDRDTAQRRGRIVATAGQTFAGYVHWKTGALLEVRPEFVLVLWEDQTYPIVHEDGEQQPAHLVRAEHVCRLRSAAFGG